MCFEFNEFTDAIGIVAGMNILGIGCSRIKPRRLGLSQIHHINYYSSDLRVVCFVCVCLLFNVICVFLFLYSTRTKFPRFFSLEDEELKTDLAHDRQLLLSHKHAMVICVR